MRRWLPCPSRLMIGIEFAVSKVAQLFGDRCIGDEDAALGSVTAAGWLGTLGATIAVADAPGAWPDALGGDPTVSTFGAGLSASTIAPVGSARAARGVNSSKTRGVKAISRSRRRRGIANPPFRARESALPRRNALADWLLTNHER